MTPPSQRPARVHPNDIANARRKSGVGTGNYVYPGYRIPRPHAVMSIPGVGSFGCDSNGNLTSGADRTISWNSFDMPITMAKGGLSSTFYYGPDHQRVKQVRSDGVTLWYAGAMEVETSAAGSTIKTYLPEGLGVEVDKSGATQLYYMHRDRLGSVVAMSNQAGSLVEKTAYDSWGKRRELASPNTPDSIDGVSDNKGYTGHEMLDQLDLVHMNGRVYDPLVARFLSADPIIQDPMHSQSYNRYSYVWNNPTNLTDPSGFNAGTPDANSGSTEVKQDCDKRCQQLKADAEREKKRTNPTGWTLRSSSKDNSNGAGSANSSAVSGAPASNGSSQGSGEIQQVIVRGNRYSGPRWVSRFPTSRDLDDLNADFAPKARRFVGAIEAAGGRVRINATLRPPERAYLMHYSSAIARGEIKAGDVPAMDGVNINWVHDTEKESIKAAEAMAKGYDIIFPPALVSRHTQGAAIDVTITGIIGREMVNGNGQSVEIRNKNDLNNVGRSYGVYKLQSDPPHWSDNGH